MCDHEWMIEGPGVGANHLLISCGLCGVEGEAQVTVILDDDEGAEDDD